MAFSTQFASFFISPFGEPSVCDELNAFLRSRRIINVEKRLIDGERGTGWLFLVEYGEEVKAQNPGNVARIDYREVLNQRDYMLFDQLRAFRKSISDKQGVPVYAIFSNEHLAAMAKSPPKAINDIQAIPGVGESRIKQYGEAFLAFFLNRQKEHKETDTQKNQQDQSEPNDQKGRKDHKDQKAQQKNDETNQPPF